MLLKMPNACEISWEFLSGSWQYWSNIHVLQNASLFCFNFCLFIEVTENYIRGFLVENRSGNIGIRDWIKFALFCY